MKRIIGCLLVACLLISNLLITSLPIASAATGNERLQMNPSHNWVNGNGFEADTDFIVRIEDGSGVRASQNVRTNNNGDFNTNWWENDIRLEIGNTIRVIKSGSSQVKAAIVQQISANINTTTSIISGNTLANSDININLYENGPHPKNSVLDKNTTSNGSGNFSVPFNVSPDFYPLSKRNEAQVSVTDSIGDSTIIWTGSPYIRANVSHNWVEGSYFPKDKDINLTLKNGPDIKKQLNIKTNSFGDLCKEDDPRNTNINWGDFGAQMETGDTVTASWTSGSKSLVLENISANIDYDNNEITGKTLPDTQIQTDVNGNEDWRARNRKDTTDSFGNFSTDYNLDNDDYDPLDLTMKSEAGVTYFNNDTLDQVMYWFGQPRMGVNITDNWFNANYLPSNTDVDVTLANSGGEKASLSRTTNSNGYIDGDFWNGGEVERGDTLSLDYEYNGSPKHLEMEVQNLRANVNVENDTVDVSAPEANSLRAEAGDQGIQRNYDLVPGETSHTFNFKVENSEGEGIYNITPRDNIGVSCTPQNGLNETRINAGSPMMTTHLTDNWVQGRNLPENANITLDINNAFKTFNKSSNSRGEVEFNWEDFNNEYNVSSGDHINLSWTGGSVEMDVSNLTGLVDVGGNKISGSATIGNSVTVGRHNVDWEDPDSHRFIETVVDSTYEADFNPYDIQARDEFWVSDQNKETGNETQINVSVPKMDVNVSHNWFDFRYLPPSTDMTIKLNNGSKGTKDFQSDPSGNYSGNWNYWEGERGPLAFGDTLSIIYRGGPNNGQLIADMPLQSITGIVNHQTNIVNGKTAAYKDVDVWVDDRDDAGRNTTSDSNGNYTINYNQGDSPYDVSPRDTVRSAVYDNEGNRTIIVYGTPRFEINLQEGEVGGINFPAETDVTVKSNNGLNGIATEKTSGNGEFWINWEEETNYKLNTGNTLFATYLENGQTVSTSLCTIPQLSGNVDVVNDTVSGTTSLQNTDVEVHVRPWDENHPYRVVNSGTGSFLANFSQPWEGQEAYDMKANDYNEIFVYDENANRFNISAGTAHLSASINWNGLSGNFLGSNRDIEIKLNDGNKGTVNLKTGGSGWFEINWKEETSTEEFEGYDLNFGDVVTVNNKSTQEEITRMTIANPLTALVNINTDRVSGQKPVGGETALYVGNRWEGNGRKIDLDSQLSTYDVGLEGYDFTFHDEGSVEHVDDDGNSTDISFGTPKIRASVTPGDQNISVEFLQPNTTTNIWYNGSLVSTSTSKPSGQVEFEPTFNLEGGKSIEVKDNSQDILTQHTIIPLKLNVDANADIVYGSSSPGGRVTCFMNPNPMDGPQYWREKEADSTGNFIFEYSKGETKDIVLGDSVHIAGGDGFGNQTSVGMEVNDVTPPTRPVIAPNKAYMNSALVRRLTAVSYDLSSVTYSWMINKSSVADLGLFGNSTNTLGISTLASGNYYAHVKARDAQGNFSQQLNQLIRIDNYKPVTTAGRKVTVKRGAVAKLGWKVTDSFTGGKATVTLKIKFGRKVIKTVKLGLTAIGSMKYYKYKTPKKKGKYSWSIYAKDQAGNNQRNIAVGTLVVK